MSDTETMALLRSYQSNPTVEVCSALLASLDRAGLLPDTSKTEYQYHRGIKIHPIKANCTEVETDDMFILVSFETPIAFRSYGKDTPCYVSNGVYSRTTNRHLRDWSRRQSASQEIVVSQEACDETMRLVRCVCQGVVTV